MEETTWLPKTIYISTNDKQY